MISIVNHLSACTEVALEGDYFREQPLESFYDEGVWSLILKVDIRQNTVTLTLEGEQGDGKPEFNTHEVNGQIIKSVRKRAFTIKSPSIWTYNCKIMATATINFLLCYLVHAVYNDSIAPEDMAKHLQDQFKYLLGADINIY